MDGEAIYLEPNEVLSRDERISRLRHELTDLEGGGSGQVSKALESIMRNPRQLKSMFNLNEEQAVNVKSLVVGSGTAAAVKYLSNAIGTELSGAIGGFLSGYIAKKMFGG